MEYLQWFEKLCAIPHGSGHMTAIRQFCVEFAEERGLTVKTDKANNVVIYKDATADMVGKAPVMLQGHMDMVCEKNPDCEIDFLTQGLDFRNDGEKIWAEGTTLGADNCLAVAYALAILDSDTISHPPLEVLFTTDEEVGMIGAGQVDGTWFQSRRLLNLDSEEFGVVTAGCAGGSEVSITYPLLFAPGRGTLYQLSVDGLRGGHSGIDIGQNRGNAIKLLGEALVLLSNLMPLRLCKFAGGAQANAIPRTASCLFVVEGEQQTTVDKVVSALQREFAQRFGADEGNLLLKCSPSNEAVAKIWTLECTHNFLRLLMELPNGVQTMMGEMVETSLNLGRVKQAGNALSMTLCLRSNVTRDLKSMSVAIQAIAGSFSALTTENGFYPPWEYAETSPLRETLCQVYRQKFGKDMVVETIHAGLECGVLGARIGQLDCVSIGPNIHHIHTPKEHFYIKDGDTAFAYVLDVLKAL